MTTAIATVLQYSNLLNITSTVAEQTRLEKILPIATELAEKWCYRILSQANYSEWYRQDYATEIDTVYTKQYPINQLKMIGLPGQVMTIENTDDTISLPVLSVFPTSTIAVSLGWWDALGAEQSVDLLLATYPILSQLVTAIELNTGWTVSMDSKYDNYPTSLLQPLSLVQVGTNKIEVMAAIDNGLVADIIGENEITLSANVDKVFIKYSAGYTVSVDNAGHTAFASVGNVPDDLITAICYIANDLMSYATGIAVHDQAGVSNNMIKSESIGDYSYTKFEKSTLDEIVEKYRHLLERYQKKSFVWANR